jgi:hypothetical protein
MPLISEGAYYLPFSPHLYARLSSVGLTESRQPDVPKSDV